MEVPYGKTSQNVPTQLLTGRVCPVGSPKFLFIALRVIFFQWTQKGGTMKANMIIVIVCFVVVFAFSIALAAPQRWAYDILDAQTDLIVGSASVVRTVEKGSAAGTGYYSLNAAFNDVVPGDYRAEF
jgi:hypothetical protein